MGAGRTAGRAWNLLAADMLAVGDGDFVNDKLYRVSTKPLNRITSRTTYRTIPVMDGY